MKNNIVFYWTITSLFIVIMLLSRIAYLYKTIAIPQELLVLPFLAIIFLPFGIVKVITVLKNQYKKPIEWPYSKLFYGIILTLNAHLMIGGREYAPSFILTLLLSISYPYKDQVRT